MSLYAQIARKHWEQVDPSRAAQLEDPHAFFEDLGNEVLTRIDQLTQDLLKNSTPATGMERIAQEATARRTAEEIALTELVWIKAPEEYEEPDRAAATEALALLEDQSENFTSAELKERRAALQARIND